MVLLAYVTTLTYASTNDQ